MSTGVEKKYDIMMKGTSFESQDVITCSYEYLLRGDKGNLVDSDLDVAIRTCVFY